MRREDIKIIGNVLTSGVALVIEMGVAIQKKGVDAKNTNLVDTTGEFIVDVLHLIDRVCDGQPVTNWALDEEEGDDENEEQVVARICRECRVPYPGPHLESCSAWEALAAQPCPICGEPFTLAHAGSSCRPRRKDH